MTDVTDIHATPGAEAKASCGCVFVIAQEQAIDARAGRFLSATSLVVVPCREGHLSVAREVGEQFIGRRVCVEMLHDLVGAMEARIA